MLVSAPQASASVVVRSSLRFVRFHYRLVQSAVRDAQLFARSSYENPVNRRRENLLGRISLYTHALEKGLSHDEPRFPFGVYALSQLMGVSRRYLELSGGRTGDPRFMAAVAVMRDVARAHEAAGVPLAGINQAFEGLEATLAEWVPSLASLEPSVTRHSVRIAGSANEGSDHPGRQRHSVRDFADSPVSPDAIRNAISAAIRSPSSCNRQPWRVAVVSEESEVVSLLAVQGGLNSYGKNLQVLLAVACDCAMFGDPYERNMPYIDGGIFACALAYELHAAGLATCMLNASHAPNAERTVRKQLGLSGTEVLICYIAVGQHPDEYLAPTSKRIRFEDVARGSDRSAAPRVRKVES